MNRKAAIALGGLALALFSAAAGGVCLRDYLNRPPRVEQDGRTLPTRTPTFEVDGNGNIVATATAVPTAESTPTPLIIPEEPVKIDCPTFCAGDSKWKEDAYRQIARKSYTKVAKQFGRTIDDPELRIVIPGGGDTMTIISSRHRFDARIEFIGGPNPNPDDYGKYNFMVDREMTHVFVNYLTPTDQHWIAEGLASYTMVINKYPNFLHTDYSESLKQLINDELYKGQKYWDIPNVKSADRVGELVYAAMIEKDLTPEINQRVLQDVQKGRSSFKSPEMFFTAYEKYLGPLEYTRPDGSRVRLYQLARPGIEYNCFTREPWHTSFNCP